MLRTDLEAVDNASDSEVGRLLSCLETALDREDGMGDRDGIGVSTGEAVHAAVTAATAAEQNEVIDLDFRDRVGTDR